MKRILKMAKAVCEKIIGKFDPVKEEIWDDGHGQMVDYSKWDWDCDERCIIDPEKYGENSCSSCEGKHSTAEASN